MKMTIEIKMDGAAFGEDNAHLEAARILREAADTLETNGICDFELADLNGNKVGDAEITGK